MKLTYIGPHDAIEIAGVSGAVDNGVEFDVDSTLAASLLDQPSNFAPADEEATALAARLARTDDDEEADPLASLTIAQLREAAEAEGIDLGDATKKDDLIAAIKAHDNTEGA